MKKYRVQIVKNNELAFLDMHMSCSPEGGLQFGLFKKKGHQLKYVGMGSTHTPITLRAIPSGDLNRLCKSHLAQTLFSFWKGKIMRTSFARRSYHLQFSWQWENCGKVKMKKRILRTKNNLNSTKRKTEMSIFALHTHIVFLHISTGWLTSNTNI